jgi:hypothetical protein
MQTVRGPAQFGGRLSGRLDEPAARWEAERLRRALEEALAKVTTTRADVARFQQQLDREHPAVAVEFARAVAAVEVVS